MERQASTGGVWFYVGIVLTVGYVVLLGFLLSPIPKFVAFMAGDDYAEIGNFLAGVFGPLALFWVIIGIQMQRVDIKLSRDALLTQIDEMRANKALNEQQLHVAESESSPAFRVLQWPYGSDVAGHIMAGRRYLAIHNRGGNAANVGFNVVGLAPDAFQGPQKRTPLLTRNDPAVQYAFDVDPNVTETKATLRVECLNSAGSPIQKQFHLVVLGTAVVVEPA